MPRSSTIIESWLPHLDTGTPAFSDGVRHSSTGRINHGHETNKTESGQREVGAIRVELKARREFINGQLEVTESFKKEEYECIQVRENKSFPLSRKCYVKISLRT